MAETLSFGVLGSANIARKNIRALLIAKKELHSPIGFSAIASRDIEKCRVFLRKLLDIRLLSQSESDIVKAYGSYEDILSDAEIDAIYIPLPSILHVQWAVRAAESGKHILLEKPAAVNATELMQIIFSCQMHKVFLLDGVMFMHHDRLKAIRQHLQSAFFGNVKRVSASFSFNGAGGDFLNNNIRTKYDCDPLGALGDLGWYCIRMGIIAFNKGNDETVFSSGKASSTALWPVYCIAKCNNWNSERVPLDCEAVISFSSTPYDSSLPLKDLPLPDFSSQVLSFNCSFLIPFRQSFEICATSEFGDKIMRCDDFVIPRNPKQSHFEVESFSSSGALAEFDTRVFSSVERIQINSAVEQEANMFDTFARQAKAMRSGGPDHIFPPERYWKIIALLTQLAVDSCMVSMKNDGKAIPIDTSMITSLLG